MLPTYSAPAIHPTKSCRNEWNRPGLFGPLKANGPLLIDAEAELPLAVSAEGFKAVAG